MLSFTDYLSPNCGPRHPDKKLDMLIVHYTDMMSAQEALDRLCDPAAQVSAHYLIDEKGKIYLLVNEDQRAWHAGVAFWQGETDINSRSIGIELAHPGHTCGYRPFAKSQIEAFVLLAKDICQRHHIPAERVLGHSDVAPHRKPDPGELFPWQELAQQGLGIWPQVKPEDRGPATEEQVAELLGKIGYDIKPSNLDHLPKVILAFQRHYLPQAMTGQADEETVACMRALIRQLGMNSAA